MVAAARERPWPPQNEGPNTNLLLDFPAQRYEAAGGDQGGDEGGEENILVGHEGV